MIASTLSSGGARAVPLPRNFPEWPACMQRRFREHAVFPAFASDLVSKDQSISPRPKFDHSSRNLAILSPISRKR